jgi:protein ImuB
VGAGEVIEPLYVCVYVPEFPAQALMRLRPELARRPVVVLAGEPPVEQVCSLNAQGSRLGVEQGMTRIELDDFVGLCVLRRSQQEERLAKAALLEAAGVFSPRVEIQPSAASAFAMVLDMTGTKRIFGSSPQAVDGMARMLNSLGFHTQLAACTNLYAAVILASSARKGPMVIPLGTEQKALSSLPLSALNLKPQQAETLSLWGLHSIGELAALPEVELVVRLGQEGKRLRLLARGEHPHLMVPQEPVFELVEFISLDAPVELLESLLFVLSRMLDQLLVRAQSRAFALASVTVKLGLDGGGEHERTIKPALPLMQRDVLLKLLHLDLQAHPPSAGVSSVFVNAEPGDRSKVQLGLFAPQLPESMRLDVTLARIAALVGENRVGRARLEDAHKPESFTMERFVVPTASPKKDRAPTATAALRRCRPPVPVVVRQQGPRLLSFRFQGRQYAVEEAYGPWRKSGEWWSASVWSQEEWDVRATAAPEEALLCVLTHDLLRQQWQIAALYD